MKLDIEKLRAKVAKINAKNGNRSDDYSKIQIWKPKPGKYTIRALHWPASYKLTTDGEPFCERWFYYNVAPYGFLAPSQFGKEDPIESLRKSLFSTKDSGDKLVAKKLFPQQRNYLPILVLKGEGANPETPIVWSFGKSIYEKLLEYFLDERILDWMDHENGFNLTVTVKQVEGKQFPDTLVELDALSGRCPANKDKKKMQEIFEAIPNLNESFFEEKSTNEITQLLDTWLKGSSTDDDSGDGSEKGSDSSASALDALRDDLQEADDKKKSVKKKDLVKETKKSASKKTDDLVDEDEESTQSSLDDAFESLMADE